MNIKKTILYALIINLAAITIGIGYYFSIPADISIETDSKFYQPGDVIVIRLNASRKVIESSIDFSGQRTRLFKTGKSSGTWQYRGLAAVSLDTRAGENTMDIRTTFANGRRYLNRRTVTVKGKTFKKTHLGSLPRTKKVRRHLSEESRVSRQLRSNISEHQLWDGLFIRPLKGRTSSPYGQKRTYGRRKSRGRHRGIDIAAPKGRKIKASNNGVISMAAKFQGIGHTILIDHGQGVYSIYMHLDKLNVQRTDKVNKGDIIGTVGSTGQSTGPHLHWGMYVNRIAVDPTPWTKKEIK